jgi:hypothetical protein
MFEAGEMGFSDAADTSAFGPVIDFGCEELCEVAAVSELIAGRGVSHLGGLGAYGW